MTEQTKQEIVEYYKGLREITKDRYFRETVSFISKKVAEYNLVHKLDDEPEMTFAEMAELLHEKISTYRGKM